MGSGVAGRGLEARIQQLSVHASNRRVDWERSRALKTRKKRLDGGGMESRVWCGKKSDWGLVAGRRNKRPGLEQEINYIRRA